MIFNFFLYLLGFICSFYILGESQNKIIRFIILLLLTILAIKLL